MAMRIKDYEFGNLLGRGTFGSVYLVRRRRDSKPFVVKEQSVSAANSISLEIALGEIRCLQTMRHPNIVAYHGAWMENSRSYILMEYATRCTLKDLLEKRVVPLKEEDALYLFSQIVLGVHHIHSEKILHRDLKPENIMLTGSNGDIVKIGDFGVSKNLREFDNRGKMCRAGSFHYMAPEMLLGKPYDFKCDVWSMGIILYEMVTKKLPFPAESLADIVETTRTKKPRPLRRKLSASLVSLASKMLRKDARYRPKTEELVVCPYLVPFIVRVCLNLGRTPNTIDRGEGNFSTEIFLKFLKLRGASRLSTYQ